MFRKTGDFKPRKAKKNGKNASCRFLPFPVFMFFCVFPAEIPSENAENVCILFRRHDGIRGKKASRGVRIPVKTTNLLRGRQAGALPPEGPGNSFHSPDTNQHKAIQV